MSYIENIKSIQSLGNNWFATDVDRCFHTGTYGIGIRLYTSNNLFVTVEGISYDEPANMLTVKAIDIDQKFIINTEPDNELFKTTLLQEWKDWDKNHGANMGEDRCDYKPWALTSLKALAARLKVYHLNENDKFEMYIS